MEEDWALFLTAMDVVSDDILQPKPSAKDFTGPQPGPCLSLGTGFWLANLGTWIQGLISNFYDFLAWLVLLPVAWDGIEVLAGLAFFGYLTFGALNNDQLELIEDLKKRRVARRNLRKIGSGYTISFIFFLLCGACDLLLHNYLHMAGLLSPIGINLDPSWSPRLTAFVVVTGFFGLVMLFYPMVMVYHLGDEEDALVTMKPASFMRLLMTSCSLMGNTLVLLLILLHITALLPAGQLLLACLFVSYASTYYTWHQWDNFLKKKPQFRFAIPMFLQLLAIGFVILAAALNFHSFTAALYYTTVISTKYGVVNGTTVTTVKVTTTISTSTG